MATDDAGELDTSERPGDDARGEPGERGPAGEHRGGRSAGRPGEHAKPAGGSFVKQHRDALIITITTIGVLIAWLSFKKKSSAQTADPTGLAYTSGTGLPAPGQPDPNASGAVDGFAANLSHMQDVLDQLQANLGPSGSTSTPSSTPAAFDYSSMAHSWANEPVTAPARFLTGRAAQGLRYIRNRTTGAIYQVNPNGRLFHLGQSQYAALGKPKYTEYGHAPPKKKPVKAPATKKR